MSVLQLLNERDDLYHTKHLHLGDADVRGCVITQEVYVCVARKETTYDLGIMRQFQESFDGFKIGRRFAAAGSHLTLGEVEQTERTQASVRDLQTLKVDVRGIYGYTEAEMLRPRHLEQRFHIQLLPCRRLLGRHEPGNFQPPDRTGNHPIDRLIVKFFVH